MIILTKNDYSPLSRVERSCQSPIWSKINQLWLGQIYYYSFLKGFEWDSAS